jgi:hypothetical protein
MERTRIIKEETVKLLCLISTVKTNRFYIPGETKMVERLRKDAFDKGIYATLTYLFYNIPSNPKLSDLKCYIKDKVLNLIELNDLYYHAIVIEQLIEILKVNPNMFNTAAANDGDNNELAGNQSIDGSE